MARPERQSRRPAREERTETPRDQKPIKTIAGRVGRDPEWKKAGESDVIEFSVAITMGYGDDAPPPMWVECTAWDRKPEMQEFIEDEIYKGSAVAVEGTFSSNQGPDGKTYHKINVVRVGLVEWFKPGEAAPAARPARAATPPPVGNDDFDDLPF